MSSRTLRLADEDALRALLSRGGAVYSGAERRALASSAPQLAAAPAVLPIASAQPPKRSPRTTKPAPVKISEDDLQIACFQWVELMRHQYKILTWLVHVPNGGKRPRGAAGRLKAMGVKKGVLDVILPLPYNGWAGLAIELKVGSNKPTEEQEDWLAVFAAAGYYTAVCYDFASFQKHVTTFLTTRSPDSSKTREARLTRFIVTREA